MTPDWTLTQLGAALVIFVAFLVLVGWVARYWPADAPFGDWAEEDRRWDD